MENKLTWVELKKTVARQTHLNDKEVNLILTTWLDEMAAALKRGEELHINGLGTFRMKTMKARKSVNVTTGEAIILPETERLTFTTAAGLEEQLKDSVSTKPMPSTDPIQKLSEQADEILDILGEMGVGSKAATVEAEAEIVQPKQVEIPDYVIPEKPAEPEKPAALEKPTEPEKTPQNRLWLTAGITILVFIGLLIGLFFFFQHKMEQWLTNLRQQAEMEQVEEVAGDRWQVADTIDDRLQVEDTTDSRLQVEDTIITEVTNVTNYREYTEFLGTEQMHQDSRLAWMAYRYYGNKKLWVFIYDANRDHLTNPQHIAVGTSIRIPRLSQEIIDLSTPELQELVQQMSDEFLGK